MTDDVTTTMKVDSSLSLISVLLLGILSGCATTSVEPVTTESLCKYKEGTIEPGVIPGLVVGAALLTEENAQKGQGVYVRMNGLIGKVGPYEVLQTEYPKAASLDCRGVAVLSPGFVNAHEHTAYSYAFPDPNRNSGYEHRDEWRLGLNDKVRLPSPQSYYYGGERHGVAKIAWTEIRHLIGGSTTIGGSGGVPGLARNVGLKEQTGDLAVYDFEADVSTFPFSYSVYTDLKEECSGGGRHVFPEMDDMNLTTVAYVPHVGEGRPENCAARREVQRYLDRVRSEVDRRFSIVHGVATNKQDYERMVRQDVTLVWSPRSNLALYGETIDIKAALDAGVRLALGTDWSPSGSFNMREEVACAKHVIEEQVDEPLSHRDFWRMATENSAYALGLEDRLGSLKTGQAADMLLIKARSFDAYEDVLTATPNDVLGVWVGGEPLLLAPGISREMNVACEDLVDATPGLCADLSELDLTIRSLVRYSKDAVPLTDTRLQSPCAPDE